VNPPKEVTAGIVSMSGHKNKNKERCCSFGSNG
jgi:hypothetical protein